MGKGKKRLLMGAALLLCMAIGFGVPLLVFGWMDHVTLGQTKPIAAQTGKLVVSSSDLPLVEQIHNVLGATNNAEQSIRPASLEEMQEGLRDLLDSGTLPQWVQEIWKRVCREETGSATLEYGADVASYGYSGPDGVSCYYTVDLTSERILSFQLYTKEDVPASQQNVERQEVMKRYIQYLGLDVLGDWTYNGNRYESSEAKLFVNVVLNEPDSGAFSVGVEL